MSYPLDACRSRIALDRRLVAAQWIVRIPRIAQRLEPHRAGVDHEQAADKTFTEADDFTDDFQRHQRAEHARQRAQDAGFGARRHGAGRWRLGKKTAVSRIARSVSARFVRANGRERAIEGADRRGDERFLCKVAGIGDEITGCEVIRSIRDDVVTRNQIERIGCRQPHAMCLDAHMRIEALHRFAGTLNFRLADVAR